MEKRLLHGGDYNPDQWLARSDVLADDLALMTKARAHTFSVGIFAWAALEPSEGRFEFGWLDKVMDDIAGIGGNVILATPSGARPAWLSGQYPEVLRTNARREKQLHGARHNHCFSSPVYREKTRIINTKLAERYKDHAALFMWHISNEYSGDCHCALCQENFRRWLKNKYGDIDALNAAYWNAFWANTRNDFSQIESPSPIGETGIHALNLDWNRFVTDQTVDFYHNEIAPLRQITPDIPITTNFMGEFITPAPHPFMGLDYGKFAREVDVISWDAYPPWHNDYESTAFTASKLAFLNDYFRALKNQPFLILESTPSRVNWHPVNKAKRPGMHMLSAVAALAHGADAVMYFQWRASRGASEKLHGAVVGHDNSADNRVFKDVQAVGTALENAMEIKGSQTPARVAILYDTENHWALGDAQGFHKGDKQYPGTVHSHYKAFWDEDIPVDVITKDKDLIRYKMVVAPMLYITNEKQMEDFRAYVAGGGVLVATYVFAVADDNDLAHWGGFPPALRELFGINVLETDILYPKDRNDIAVVKGRETLHFKAVDFCTILEECGAKVLGRYSADFYAGTPAVTRHDYGKGRAYFIGARTEADFLRDFYNDIIEDLWLRADLPVTVTPSLARCDKGVSVQIRQNAEFSYYFVMNYTEHDAQITLSEGMTDLLSGVYIPAGCHGMKPYGVHILKQKRR